MSRWITLTFLGTSAGTPTRTRSLPSVLVHDSKRFILLDCGEGAQHRLLQVGVSVCRIDIVLITHLHGDHVFGLPGLISSMALLGRTRDLTIVGPPGLREMLCASVRFIGSLPFKVHIVEVNPGGNIVLVVEDGELEIKCVEAQHSITNIAYLLQWRLPVGRFRPDIAQKLGVPVKFWRALHVGERVILDDGRAINPEDVVELRRRGPFKIVYSGDTAPCESIIELSKDADVLIHEATFSAEEEPSCIWAQGHSRTVDAAEIAKKAGVRVLILTHISARYEGLEHKLLQEAQSIFRNTYIANDLEKYYIEIYP
ncbi:MAG: ribonuclease Z [Crenarchaeota archaeon]|nr:ribonuclease Z [Thermoproteota archaeon]